MSKWALSPVNGLHDPSTGALVGFLGMDGREYMLPARGQGQIASISRDVLVLGKGINDGTATYTRTSNNSTDATVQQIGPTVVVPGGLMQADSVLRVHTTWSCTNNNGGSRNCATRYGTNADVTLAINTTNIVGHCMASYWAAQSLTAQKFTVNTASMGGTVGSSAVGSQSQDTRIDQNIVFRCNWTANQAITDTITLEEYYVELLI